MNKSLKKTLLEMSLGILVYEIVLSIAAIFVYKYLNYTLISLELGILVGFIVTLLMLFDMGYAMEESISSKDSKYAQRTTFIHSVGRKLGLVVIIAIFWKSSYVNVVAIIIATLGLKPGAYLQPFMHKLLSR